MSEFIDKFGSIVGNYEVLGSNFEIIRVRIYFSLILEECLL